MKQRLIIAATLLIAVILSGWWISTILDNQTKPKISEHKVKQLEQQQFKSADRAADAIDDSLYSKVKYKGRTYGGGSDVSVGVIDYTVKSKEHYITNFYIMKKSGKYHVIIGRTDQHVTDQLKHWTEKVDGHQFHIMTGIKEKVDNDEFNKYKSSFSSAVGEDYAVLIYEK